MMTRIGDFFFRHRNRAFPLIVLALYTLAPPTTEVLGSALLEHAKDVFALSVSLLGLGVRASVIGYAYIKRGGVNKRIYAENLVTEGIFGLCRNPLYLGNMLIYAGVFLLHGDPLVAGPGIALYAFIYQSIVLAEERYLSEKFGEGYAAYCADAPRWLPRFSRFRAATEGMAFNFRRVLVKDYSTIANTLIALAVTELYRYLATADSALRELYVALLGGMIIGAAIAALFIRLLKKRGVLTETEAA